MSRRSACSLSPSLSFHASCSLRLEPDGLAGGVAAHGVGVFLAEHRSGGEFAHERAELEAVAGKTGHDEAGGAERLENEVLLGLNVIEAGLGLDDAVVLAVAEAIAAGGERGLGLGARGLAFAIGIAGARVLVVAE